MGIANAQMPVWDPYADDLAGQDEATLQHSKVILWKGHCSVHQMFRPEHVDQFREQYPGDQDSGASGMPTRGRIDKADVSGSTGKIITQDRKCARRDANGPSAPNCTWCTV